MDDSALEKAKVRLGLNSFLPYVAERPFIVLKLFFELLEVGAAVRIHDPRSFEFESGPENDVDESIIAVICGRRGCAYHSVSLESDLTSSYASRTTGLSIDVACGI